MFLSVPIILKDGKFSVGGYYKKWLGSIPLEEPDYDLLNLSARIKYGSDLLTGGPLKNVKNLVEYAIETENQLFGHWTAQGGFVGSNICTPDQTLEKFKDKKTIGYIQSRWS